MGSLRDVGHGQPGGAAVIASNIPIYADVVRHNATGLMAEHNDEGAWYDSIERLIKDEALRRKFQVAGHSLVMKHFNIHNRWRDWESCYMDIIELDRKQRRMVFNQARVAAHQGAKV
jgi:glycosyltransferase involved in cell wall biosynthesis